MIPLVHTVWMKHMITMGLNEVINSCLVLKTGLNANWTFKRRCHFYKFYDFRKSLQLELLERSFIWFYGRIVRLLSLVMLCWPHRNGRFESLFSSICKSRYAKSIRLKFGHWNKIHWIKFTEIKFSHWIK